jgi:hypothetical protein
MGGGSKKQRERKKRALAANTGATADKGDDNASPPKKPRAAAPAELTKEVKEAAKAFRKHADNHASGWKVQAGENAAVLVERVAEETKGGYNLIAKPVAQELEVKQSRRAKLNATRVRNALEKHLTSVPAAAFVVAGAPPKKKEEEGFVEGSIDVKTAKDGDVWHRYNGPAAAGDDTPGVSRQQIETALEKQSSDPKNTYAEDRGFEVRRVTPATRCATADNKVVRGFHEEKKKWGKRKSEREMLADKAKRDKEDEEAKVADAAAAKEKTEVDYVISCAEFGMACSSVPPLPKGATEADRERLQREALEAFYGRSASSS